MIYQTDLQAVVAQQVLAVFERMQKAKLGKAFKHPNGKFIFIGMAYGSEHCTVTILPDRLQVAVNHSPAEYDLETLFFEMSDPTYLERFESFVNDVFKDSHMSSARGPNVVAAILADVIESER